MTWGVYQYPIEDYLDVHVVPLSDRREHQLVSPCPCLPTINTYGKNHLVTHNAWDGREFYEVDEADARQLVMESLIDQHRSH